MFVRASLDASYYFVGRSRSYSVKSSRQCWRRFPPRALPVSLLGGVYGVVEVAPHKYLTGSRNLERVIVSE